MGVVQTGVPMVLAGALLTFLLVRLAAPSPDPQRSAFTRSPVSGARSPLAAPSVAPPVFTNQAAGPISSPAPASGVLVFPKAPAPAAPPPPADREQTALQELEELRVVVWRADRIARTRLEGTNVASLSPQTTIEATADR
jgi:hypothetical protein